MREPREQINYFAYGSNMSSRRLKARVPSASFVAMARLSGHSLRFHKHSLVDDSAKCDAFETGEAADVTFGVLFRFDATEQAALDMCEGEGYRIAWVEVELENGERQEALTYLAVLIKTDLQPYSWYRRHVLAGAREHGLPADYIAAIEQIVAIEDPDHERCRRELAIYQSAAQA